MRLNNWTALVVFAGGAGWPGDDPSREHIRSALQRQARAVDQRILAGAAGIILVHNHPSGDPTPSADDRTVTRQLVDAGRLLDVPCYDHVIIAGDRYVSFAEAGLL